ncbi:MAG: CRTAC1 family protein, partial [Cyclobacteriaceae bacterium]|nr:CRTAC1 family protein [Cyclobacteriaceae bacterium]
MNLFRSIYILIIITLFTLPSYSQGFSEIGDQLGISYDFIAKEYGGGVSFVDFNQDGLDDLTFATPGGTPIRFHLNNGSGFTEIDPLVSDTTEVKQVLWVDYNNDGLLDLYITSVFKNRLYKNLGNLSFEDVTDVCGFNDPLLISYCATWFDYNHDGLLDLAVAHRTPEESGFITLYKNLGNEQFQDVTIKSGLKNKGNSVLSMTSFDYNNDGWDDLFLAQDWEQGNQLLENRGNGTFRDVSFIKNANQKMNSMTATIGDFNSDGWFDIYVSNTREGNILLRNDEGNVFTEVSDSLGVQIKSLTFGSVFFDADNDMDLDLMVFGFQINYIYENPGDGSPFIQVNDPWGFSSNRFFNNGVALGDFDGNGFSDVAVSSLTRENFTQGKNTFWKNNFNSNNYLVVDLNGTISNKNAVGARLELTTNGKTIIRRIGCGESYSSQHSNSQYFGVGSNTLIDELIIKWPSGNSSILNNIPANQKISIEEPFGGCMDSNACNYNPNALYDNNSCRYAPLYYDCTGCINDVDEDGVCDELEISGCIDIYSCNFNSEATEDDGSCWYIPTYSIVGDSSVAPLILE